jgi:arylsulfatase A-like enzyme
VGVDRGFETWSYLPGFDSRPQIAAEIVRWLGARDPARRFFLYVHLMDAHQHPFLPPATREARIATLTPAQQAQLVAAAPGSACEIEDAPLCRQYLAYSAAIAQLRQMVSELLDALESSGALDETVVVLFADHGEEFLDHAGIEAELAVDPRGTYGIGHGHGLFGELLRVPLRVWHPDVVPGPSETPASVVDIAPTLLDYLGVPAPASDGHSLRPALEGGDFDPERALYAGSLAFGPRLTAVVRGGWKGIAGEGIPPLYYDLARDPRERTPRGDPGGIAALIAAYGAQARSASAPLSLDDESVRALQAIGYLENAPDASK